MDVLTDEHEREEAVRRWWKEHWKPIILGIVIALAGIVAFRQYQAYELRQSQQLSYELYLLKSNLATNGLRIENEVRSFMDGHNDLYGALIALDMANHYMGAGNYAKATEYIEFSRKYGGELVSSQATLILARLQTQMGNYDQALQTVAAVTSAAYKAEASEVKGDIFLAKGDTKAAHDAYLETINNLSAAKLPINPVLQMKFDNVIEPGDTPAYKVIAAQAEERAAKLAAPQAVPAE